MRDLIKQAKLAAFDLAQLDGETKNKILSDFALALKQNKQEILQANQKDQHQAKKMIQAGTLTAALFSRLQLNEAKFDQLVNYPLTVKELADPTGKITYQMQLDDELKITKYTEPIGLIAAIFESRPEVVVQISSLAIKSGNGLILKGGSEAQHTNLLLSKIAKAVLEPYNLFEAIVLLQTRLEIDQMLQFSDYIDLIIPRGSNKFVKYIQQNTAIPVLGHAEGICHLYVDGEADLAQALPVVIDAKIDYPSACNSLDTLLLAEPIAEQFMSDFIPQAVKHKIELLGDAKSLAIAKKHGYQLTPVSAWDLEHSSLRLSIRVIAGLEAAIAHINQHGSHHTDAILTTSQHKADKFFKSVDSACVFHNASTRFSDGYVFGLGAEVGISTGKIHARGPVGLDGLLTTKWQLSGNGQIKADYGPGTAKKRFQYKPIKI